MLGVCGGRDPPAASQEVLVDAEGGDWEPPQWRACRPEEAGAKSSESRSQRRSYVF